MQDWLGVSDHSFFFFCCSFFFFLSLFLVCFFWQATAFLFSCFFLFFCQAAAAACWDSESFTFVPALTSANSLLGTRQDPWSVNDADALQDLVGHLGTLEPGSGASGQLEKRHESDWSSARAAFYWGRISIMWKWLALIKDVSAIRPKDWRLPSPHPRLRPAPCYCMWSGIALTVVGFLMENERECQNQTIGAANDMRLGTTAPLPVAHELSESTSSQDRKSKQRERRKYCWQAQPNGGRGALTQEHEGLSCSRGLFFVPSCLALTTHCFFWQFTLPDSTCRNFAERNVFEGSSNRSPKSRTFGIAASLSSPRVAVLALWPPPLNACTLHVLVWVHRLSSPLSGDIASLPCFFFFPQIRQVPPRSEIWHKDQKFQRDEEEKRLHCYLSFPPLLSLSTFGRLSVNYRAKHRQQSYLFRKVFPKGLSLRKGLLGSTISAFPGMTFSTSPCMMAVKQSVVGSGPTRLPGISCSSRYLARTQSSWWLLSTFARSKGKSRTAYLMKVVFPVEYWPTTNTIGLLSKSASSRLAEWKSWKP